MNLAKVYIAIFLGLGGLAATSSAAQEQPTRKAAIDQRRRSIDEFSRKRDALSQESYRDILWRNKVDMTSSGLIAALGDREPTVRLAAVVFLGKQQDRAAVSALKNSLKDPSSAVRLTSARELSNLDDPYGFAVVEAETKNEDPSRRLGAVGLIASFDKFPDKKARVVDLLVGSLKDENKDIRQIAAGSLALIGDINAIPALRAARDRETDSTVRMIMNEHIRWLEYLQTLKP